MYNIEFTLGDYSCDGHCQYKEYHMVSNYSIKDITDAYKKAVDLLKFDFIKICCTEYDEFVIKPEYVDILINYRIIDKKSTVNTNDFLYRPLGSYVVTCCDEFVEIFIKIIKLILPDFYMRKNELNEQTLSILDGAGYGLFE